MDYQALPPVDLFLAADPDAAVPALLTALKANATPKYQPAHRPVASKQFADDALTNEHLPLSWDADWWVFRHPLDQIGGDGGGGVGGGPGISVGRRWRSKARAGCR